MNFLQFFKRYKSSHHSSIFDINHKPLWRIFQSFPLKDKTLTMVENLSNESYQQLMFAK